MIEIIQLITNVLLILGVYGWLLVFYLYLKPSKPTEKEPPKVDKYEDYRDPSTGRLRGKKVGL